MCFSRAKITKFTSRGGNLIVTCKLSKCHISEWRYHPRIKVSAGSLLLSSAILLTVIQYTRIKVFMEVPKIYFFSEKTFGKL